ncbi:MAG TPA: serine/threonine-protein kinase [Chloroflexia bacterium]|nr:serine/threonine-protein kinase [Chloroflexia bacterium]
MLIKRLQQVQSQSGNGADDLSQSTDAADQNEPVSYDKGVSPTEVMPGTAPLPRNTILQGRYDVEQVIGIGGMSTVYKARDLRFNTVARYCAIKEMPDTAPDPRTGQLRLAVFEREASLLATLSHPGITKIYDFFSSHGRVYLVLEYIDGKDLETQLDLRKAAMQEDEVVKWAVQICEVLEYLHGHHPQPIVFRDMKPSNIIVTPDGKVTLIDFGIAKVFQSDKRGTMIGTEGYAPPEQYRGLAEPRGDIYALGATMHHLLTNFDPRTQTPFTFQERPIRNYNSRVSEYIESVILRAVEYDIDRRWPSALAFRQALLQSNIFDNRQKRRQSGELDAESESFLPSSQVPKLSSSISDLGYDSDSDSSNSNAAPSGMLVQPPNIRPPAQSSAPTGLANVQAGGAQVLWTFTSDDEIRSSPLCEKGVVFCGSYDTNLYALNAKTGDFLWKAPTKAGICSSPVLADDALVIGSEDNYVYALDARRGTQMWSYRTGAPVRSSPKVHKDVVFIGSDDQYVYALHSDTGQVAWRYRTWNFVRGSAAFAHGLVFIGSSDGNLYALDVVNGTLRWKLHTLGAIISTPLVIRNNVIVGSMDNYIYAVDVDTGFTSWRFECQRSVSSSPAMAGERAIVGSSDGFLYCLDGHNGRILWNFDTGSQITSSPAVSLVNDAIYFGATNNNVYSLDINTGEERWKYKTRGPVVSSPSVDDGIVYVGSLDRKLYALAV